MPTRYDLSPTLQSLTASLKGRTIHSAILIEDGDTAYVRLHLDDHRTIEIGACGNLHDEAYLLLHEAT